MNEEMKPAGKVVTMYTIQDDKMEVHGYLHLCDTDAQAVRQFVVFMNRCCGVSLKVMEIVLLP